MTSSCPSRASVENSEIPSLGVPPSGGPGSHPSALSAPSAVNCVRAQVGVSVTPDSADPDILHIRASDETLDRYKEVIVASGWRLENYLRNPVIQNAHQYGDIIFTIGRAEKTWVSGNALLQTWRFASNENPLAKIARDLYRAKFLQAASVGFIPLKWEDSPGSTGDSPVKVGGSPTVSGFRRRYLEQELLEVSAVGIPANPNALTLALRAGAVEHSDLRELYSLLRHLIRDHSCNSCHDQTSNSVHSVLNPSAFASLLPQLRSILLTLNRKETQP